MKKPKHFKGQVFEVKLHQLSKHTSAANITISTCNDSIKNVSTHWIDDLILQLTLAKKELESKHEFEIVAGDKYYSMKEKTRDGK
jgi:hypothetical protein